MYLACSITLLTFISLVLEAFAQDLALVARATPPTPASTPISVSPSQYWEGDDGPWSTFTVRVGTPAQYVRTLVSTASQVSWIVLETVGCKPGDTVCAAARGSLYNNNASSTWSPNGFWQLYNERNLGINVNGLFGNETLGLGLPGSNGPNLENQIIATIGTENFYLGMLAVNPKRTNYTGIAEEGQESYISSLKRQNLIPSLSFGYTAGAQYRLKKVLGSLTLGGYDRSRFTPNNMTFSFAPDTDRDLVVGIQKIVSTDQDGTIHNILQSGVNAYVDSTIPEIWLPLEACRAFEEAFGLTYDTKNRFYPVNDVLHQRLLSQNASVSFTLGNTYASEKTIEIILPYASFDLQATQPFSPNGTKYFPLQRAANDTQITLGRTFLQESYLTVDWERANFSISQCIFDPDNMQQELVSIRSVNGSSNSTVTATDKKSSNSGVIIGVAVGVVAALVLVAVGVVTFFVRQHKKRPHVEEDTGGSDEDISEKVRQGYAKAELNTDFDHTRYELGDGDGKPPGKPLAEWVDEKARHPGESAELVGDKALPEMNGGDVAASELSAHALGPFHEMYDPSVPPAELPADQSRELQGSSPDISSRESNNSSPMSRPADQWPANGSPRPSLFNRSPVGSSSLSRRAGHDARSTSSGTRSTRSRPSVSSPTSHSSGRPSSPSRSGASSPRDNHVLSPISPIRDSDEGSESRATFSLARGLNPFTHPPRASNSRVARGNNLLREGYG